MSAGFKSGPPTKLGQSGGLSPAAPGSQAILLDKFNRRSTPDSEALASSDEETDTNLNNSRSDFHNNHHTATASNAATATVASTHMSQGQQQPLSQVQPPQSQSQSQSQSQQPPKPVRRASWLNDTSQGLVRPRNESFNSASMSPTTSHPTTPATDASAGGAGPASGAAATWGAHAASSAGVLNRAHSNVATAFPWGTAMWNSERKDPPSRLSEVLPSPTSAIPPGSAGGSFFSGGNADGYPSQTSPATRDGLSTTSQIPFAIPLHPTPKTYRSQSYSVGQLEPDVAALTGSATSPSLTSTIGGGGSSLLAGSRSGRPIAGLQHRPSRPSMLSEMSNDGGMLGKVKEVDDDDESTNDSLQGSQHLTAEAKTIEMLTRENAMLRQHASQQYHNARIRPRASTGAAYRLDNGYGLQESLPEETSDYAIDELDEINDGDFAAAAKRANNGRRMSEFAAAGSFRSPFSVENRKLESVKKAFWQTTPAGFSDASPSRRHSFADIPTRQASISSISEVVLAHEANAQEQQQPGGIEFTSPFDNAHSFAAKSAAAAAAAAAQSMYGNGPGVSPGASQISPQQLLQQQHHQQAQQQHQQSASASYGSGGGAYPSPYGLHAPAYAARPTSPQRGMYGLSQPNRSTPLHVVLFKCARADVFYIQEGTGLTVKPGDLVIVEADRGTDLGTVAVDNVDWVEARRLKEHYAEEQYKWLMMYSQNAAAAQDGVGAGLMASSTGLQGSAIGGMGPPGQHHVQEPSTSELKPKLIKRLAQSHEIHALRDKEGNEAKAKRVCMQKVKEHGLNMEILDAEFQMDWKKLTFYYFADAYINFNSLVTDLFKIYKTRIWMSAINPASFASQPLGLQAPSGIGPGAVGVNRAASASERRPQQGGQVSPPPTQAASQQQQQQVHQQQHQHQSTYSPVPSNRGYPGGVNPQPPAMAGSGTGPNAGYPGSFPYSPYAAFGNVPRASGMGYGGQGMSGPAPNDNYAMGYAASADYHMMRNRFPAGQPDINQNSQGMSPLAPSGEWVGAFQGLSLNTR